LQHEQGLYSLTPQSRACCGGSKKTLFNKGDIEQLVATASAFDAHPGT